LTSVVKYRYTLSPISFKLETCRHGYGQRRCIRRQKHTNSGHPGAGGSAKHHFLHDSGAQGYAVSGASFPDGKSAKVQVAVRVKPKEPNP